MREHTTELTSTRAARGDGAVQGGGNGWRGFLRTAVLRVPDPEAAASELATLLGGTVSDATVEYSSDTRIVFEEGPAGFAGATLDAVGAGGDEVEDPDGRPWRLVERPTLVERLDIEAPRLGHLTFESPDPLAAQAFYESLGFRLSEALGEQFRWLRCNPVHHTVAFSRGPAPALHHVAVELPDRSDLVEACDRLAQNGQTVEFGPGRHLVGNNLFIYFVGRHGIRYELFCELERIDDPERPPLVHEGVDRGRSINVWGPAPPDAYFRGV